MEIYSPVYAYVSGQSDLLYSLRLDNELSARPPRGRHGLVNGTAWKHKWAACKSFDETSNVSFNNL